MRMNLVKYCSNRKYFERKETTGVNTVIKYLFVCSNKLQKHLKVQMKVKPFSCWQCDKSFDQSSHLLTNVKVHSGREPYRCYPCTKSFAQSSNLKTRLKIHTGEKPYMCSMCVKSSVMCLAATFKSSHLWEILLLFTVYKVVCTVVCPAAHLKIHSEKVFRCSQCTESFSLSGALLKRSKTHTGEKLEGCFFCNK